jgi:hypothetical protein
VRKRREILPFKPKRKGGPRGNQKNLKHGAYSARLTPEEQQEREQFESELITDLAGNASTAQRALIRRASFLEIRLRRCERATEAGMEIADEHILAWINAQRLLLCALGLEAREKRGPNLQDYLKAKEEHAKQGQEKVQ